MIFHLHKWAPWSQPIPTGNGGHKQQWRVCAACNKAELRTLKWDEQSKVEAVRDACIESLHSQEPEPGSHLYLIPKKTEAADLLKVLRAIALCDICKWPPGLRNSDSFNLWARAKARKAIFEAPGEAI